MSGEVTPEEAYQQAIEQKQPRFFRASGGAARGRTGTEDTQRFAENLMVLQECALLLGEKMDMSAVSHAVCYEDEETAGFCYDQNSDPHDPRVVGAIVNKRMPMRQMVKSMRDFINS